MKHFSFRQTTERSLTRGFTLVETLVAITILLVGVLGPLSIAANGIADGLFAQNQLAANYLAQEALEVVVNKRQTNRDSNPGDDRFDTIFADIPAGNCGNGMSTTCVVDPVAAAGDQLIVGNQPPPQLVFDTSQKLFRDRTSLPPADQVGAVFTRLVDINPLPDADSDGEDDGVVVAVTIQWKNRNNPRSLTLKEHLYVKGP